MESFELCRLCAGHTDVNSTNLFDRKSSLLGQIKDVTGCSLRNSEDLPPYICLECEHVLSLAHQFRKRCLETQLYFCSAKYREKLRKDITTDNVEVKEISPTIELDMDPLKYEIEIEEREDEEEEADDENIYDDIYPIDSLNLPHTRKISNPVTRKQFTGLKSKEGRKLDLICDQCGNHFTCRHHFKTHLRRHTNDKPYQCEVCPNKFFTHSELKRHMRRHTGEKPFACKHCERRFTDYSTRIKHERIHTNERPFACTQCNKSFTTSYVLKNHMLIHTGERFFKCSLCNKSFQRKTHLTVHNNSIMHKQMMEKHDQQEHFESIEDNE